MAVIATFVALVFLYSLVSQRLERTIVTPPMLFTAAGMLVPLLPSTVTDLALDRQGLLKPHRRLVEFPLPPEQ